MNVLEKILEEIKEATFQEDAPIYVGDMEMDGYVRESRVKEIICSHMADVPDADNDWIPVEERLPEDNPDSDYYESVIVTLLDGRCAPGVYRNGDKEWWVEAEDGGKKYTFESDVIAWRPLPEPYKQNLEFIKDVHKAIVGLFYKYNMNRLQWSCYIDNPAIRGYRNFIKKYGGRECGHYRQIVKLQDGKLHDIVEFEILAKEFKG